MSKSKKDFSNSVGARFVIKSQKRFTRVSSCYVFISFLVAGVNFYEVNVLQSVRTVGVCVAMILFQDGLTQALLWGHA